MKVSDKQILEWTENPVTLALKKEAELELENIRTAPLSDNLCRGDAQRTQENLIENVTKELEFEAFIAFLDGDWSELEDVSNEIEDEFE